MARESSKLPTATTFRAKQLLGEPVATRYHKIRGDGKSENSPIVNTTVASRDHCGFEVGREVRIDVYDDFLIMRLSDPEADPEVDNG